MKPCHRICASILVVATALLAAPPALAKDVAIPQETLHLPGLHAPAEIRVDRWGVPHIYAGSEADLFYVQGFNAARDRLFQIDLWRRRGLGQLSEVFGPGFFEQDRAARLFLYRGDMAAEWAAYGVPGLRAVVERFVAGINASDYESLPAMQDLEGRIKEEVLRTAMAISRGLGYRPG